ncbi:hypothetical protein RHGRI_006573 [Rhododendron griersonianum]|uniref:CCHC-type domain-containing protein n=1 Tax=Rhododendron griersonianum TaxID=479676 RepID=A0AAV6KTI4_9ERIC|nr:hypothetical protein RHGRI_006573 [Rhododendron griersonianum]
MENNSTITLRQTLFPNLQRGRRICFSSVGVHKGALVFYSTPFDFFGDGGDDDNDNSSNPDVEDRRTSARSFPPMECFLIFDPEEDRTLRTTAIGGWLCSPDLHNSINLYVYERLYIYHPFFLCCFHRSLGEEDEGGERGNGLGSYDHGGRTWERCGYGGGGRYALDIAPFKKCPKCSFPGHIERDCKVTPCFRCMGFGHMAMDCKGIPCFSLGEEDEGGEKGSGLGCHDHGGRTLERCGYAGGGRIAIVGGTMGALVFYSIPFDFFGDGGDDDNDGDDENVNSSNPDVEVSSPNPSSFVRNAISKGRDNSTLTVADNNLVTLLDMNSHGSNSGIRTSSVPGKNHLEQIYVDNTNLYIDPSDGPTGRQIKSLNAEIRALKAEMESKEKVSPDNVCTVDQSEGTRGPLVFYSIPLDFFGDGGDDSDDDDNVNSSNPDVEGIVPFYKTTDIPPSSTLSSVGSSLFVAGGTLARMPLGPITSAYKIHRFDTTAPPADGWPAISMLAPRASPVTDGKLYVFVGCGPCDTFTEILGEEDEGGERGSGLGGYDHVGRTWERCSYGGGGRYALDIAPFKISPKCLFPGHMERDCRGVPCFRCRGFGHTAWDCKGIPYCGGGGWNFSSSGIWVNLCGGTLFFEDCYIRSPLWYGLALTVFFDRISRTCYGNPFLAFDIICAHMIWKSLFLLSSSNRIAAVEYILGTLVHSFDWRLPDGVELDMSEAFGLVLQKALLLSAVVVPRILTSAYES